MSLDLAILNDDGTLNQSKSLTVADHQALCEAAKPINKFPFISRLMNYYEDAEYNKSEVSFFRIEIQQIILPELENCIQGLLDLCDFAIANSKGIIAIAD
jgi:hypothetical protein